MKKFVSVIGDYLFEPDLGWYYTYGLEVHLLDGSGGIRCFHDLSVNLEKVTQFADLCNRNDFSLGQFQDLVEAYGFC